MDFPLARVRFILQKGATYSMEIVQQFDGAEVRLVDLRVRLIANPQTIIGKQGNSVQELI